MSSETRPVVFMDIQIGETPAGRIKMELFSDIVPKYVPVSVILPDPAFDDALGQRRTSDSFAQENIGDPILSKGGVYGPE